MTELNDALANFLGMLPADATGKPFWPILGNRFPEWEPSLEAFSKSPGNFKRLQLSAAQLEAPPCFNLEMVRHPSGSVVRLNSALPPAPELAEGPWDESLRSDTARRELFMRLLRAESQLDNLVQRSPGVIFSQRADFGFHFVSPRIAELTGVEASQWLKQPNLFWQIVHESDFAELRKQIKLATETPAGAATTFRIRNRTIGRPSRANASRSRYRRAECHASRRRYGTGIRELLDSRSRYQHQHSIDGARGRGFC